MYIFTNIIQNNFEDIISNQSHMNKGKITEWNKQLHIQILDIQLTMFAGFFLLTKFFFFFLNPKTLKPQESVESGGCSSHTDIYIYISTRIKLICAVRCRVLDLCPFQLSQPSFVWFLFEYKMISKKTIFNTV